MLSGAALIVIGLVAALALDPTKGRGPVSSPAEHLTGPARSRAPI